MTKKLNTDNGLQGRRTITTGYNTGLAQVAVQCFYDSFVGKQTVVHLISICAENRHLRQARNRYSTLKKDEMRLFLQHLVQEIESK